MGRNIGDKKEEENTKPINNQTQNQDQDPQNKDLKGNSKILNKDMNLLGITDSTNHEYQHSW